ncbi:hypothetical protein KAU33_02280 [Candidatus Dependentiae bacterium]|nr:hypothetical protein [Candidatus Dependentiae bacterium]
MRKNVKGMSETEAMINAMNASRTIIDMCEELKNAVGRHSHGYAWLNNFIDIISAYNDARELGFNAEIDRSKIEGIKLHIGVDNVTQRKISLQSIIRDITPVYNSTLKKFRKAAFDDK